MTADTIFTRINNLNRRHVCCVLSNAWGVMKDRMSDSDLKLILSALEHYEKKEREETEREGGVGK